MTDRRSILVIDNYDSFTFNLVHYLMELGAEVEVVRNDAVTADEALLAGHAGYLISPGPCTPNEAGISVELAKVYGGEIPILGVCLGHQSIAQAFGGRVIRAQTLMHGKTSMISHCETGLFAGLPSPFQATRYHSLVVERSSLPECFEITATAEDGEIMALRHQRYPVVGVQFHPESILTQHGHRLLDNFIDQV